MRWVTGDVAAKAGVAFWSDAECLLVGELIERKGLWDFDVVMSDQPSPEGFVGLNYGTAWRRLLRAGPTVALFIEESHGPNPMIISRLAWKRGYITRVAEECFVPRIEEINTSTWRKALGKWPRAKKGEKLPKGATKAYSVALANELSKWDFGAHDDAAESFLIGRAILKLGLIN